MATAQQVRELFTKLGYEVDLGALKKFEQGTTKAKGAMEGLSKRTDHAAAAARKATTAFKGVVAAIAAAKVGGFFAAIGEEVQTATRRAAYLGTTVQEVQRLSYAGMQSGVQEDETADFLGNLIEKAQKVLRGEKAETEKFKLLGIGKKDLQDVNGELINSTSLLKLVADRAKGVGSAKLYDACDELAGDVGRRMIGFLQKGSGEIERLRKEADKTGVVMSERLVKATIRATIASKQLKARIKGVRNMIAAKLLPGLNAAAAGFSRWINQGTRLEKVLMGVKTAAVAVGIAIAQMFLGFRLTAIGGGIALVVGLLAGLVRIATTGEGALKRFLSPETVESLKLAVIDIRFAFAELWREVKPALTKLAKAAAPLISLFGTLAKAILPAAITVFAKVLVVIVKGLTAIVQAATFGAKQIARMAEWIRETWGPELDWLDLKWRQLTYAMSSAWTSVTQAMTAAVDYLEQKWDKLLEAVKTAVGGVLAVLAGLFAWIVTKAEGIAEPIAAALSWAAGKVQKAWDAVAAVFRWLGAQAERLGKSLASSFTSAATKAKAAWDKVGETINTAWNKAKDIVGGAYYSVTKKVGGTTGSVAGQLTVPSMPAPAGGAPGPTAAPLTVQGTQIHVNGSLDMKAPEFQRVVTDAVDRGIGATVDRAYRRVAQS